MIEIEVYARSSVANIPTIILGVLLAVLIVGFAIIHLNLNGNANRNNWWRGVARLMLVEWLMLIICTTVVFRNTRPERTINLIPLSSYFSIAENSYLKEVAVINLLNVVMFLPIGMLIKISDLNANLNNWKGVMVLGLLLSVAIEVSQFVFCKGLCEVDDMIHNVIGCMIGYGVATMTLTLTLTIKKTITKKIRNEFI